MDESTQVPANGQFPPTMWTQILRASDENAPEALAALERLARVYWPPLNSWLLRQRVSPEDAADVTQSFFAHLIQKQILKEAARDKGRFRTFLLTCLRNHLRDWRAKEITIKRGGGKNVSLDETNDDGELLREPAGTGRPDEDFDREWGLLLLQRVNNRLQAEYGAAGKSDLFAHLQSFQYGAKEKSASHAEAAARLGMTEGAVKTAGSRLKERYQELIRAEIRQTVSTDEEVEKERRELIAIMSKPR